MKFFDSHAHYTIAVSFGLGVEHPGIGVSPDATHGVVASVADNYNRDQSSDNGVLG